MNEGSSQTWFSGWQFYSKQREGFVTYISFRASIIPYTFKFFPQTKKSLLGNKREPNTFQYARPTDVLYPLSLNALKSTKDKAPIPSECSVWLEWKVIFSEGDVGCHSSFQIVNSCKSPNLLGFFSLHHSRTRLARTTIRVEPFGPRRGADAGRIKERGGPHENRQIQRGILLLNVLRLTWLELKSAVTLIGPNVFASLEKVAMSEREQTAEMIKLQACSPRGNLTMTPLLNLACCAEKHTCPVQTLRRGPAVCPKQTSTHVLSDKLSPHSYEREGEREKKVEQNKHTITVKIKKNMGGK